MNDDRNPLVSSGEDGWPDPRSTGRHGLRKAYDTLALWLARAHAPGAIVGLDALGRMANFAHVHGPSRREVSALYDWLPPGRAARIARDIAALRLKNRAAIALVQDGRIDRLASLVQWPAGTSPDDMFGSRGGRVLLAAHIGAFFGIRAALHRAGRPSLMVRDLPLADLAEKAGAFKGAIDHLRAGGLVVSTIDGPGGTSTSEVECLGRRIVLRRGPFALARLTHSPLTPIVCAWTTHGRIDVRIAPAIEPPLDRARAAIEFEAVMAARTAHWLDSYLRVEPHQIWLSTLRHYLAAPKVRPES